MPRPGRIFAGKLSAGGRAPGGDFSLIFVLQKRLKYSDLSRLVSRQRWSCQVSRFQHPKNIFFLRRSAAAFHPRSNSPAKEYDD